MRSEPHWLTVYEQQKEREKNSSDLKSWALRISGSTSESGVTNDISQKVPPPALRVRICQHFCATVNTADSHKFVEIKNKYIPRVALVYRVPQTATLVMEPRGSASDLLLWWYELLCSYFLLPRCKNPFSTTSILLLLHSTTAISIHTRARRAGRLSVSYDPCHSTFLDFKDISSLKMGLISD